MLSDLFYRLRAILQRGAMERELDDELRFHLERETEKHIRAGMNTEDASRHARIAFGGIERVKDESRDARGVALLDAMSQDLRYAIRGLRAKPGFTAAVVLTLGLGIGANAAMFGVVDRLMFRSPTYLQDPGRVNRVFLFWTTHGKETSDRSFEYTRYADLARWTTSFDRVAAFAQRVLAVGSGDDARETQVATVSATYFDFFDARPALGRYFVAGEDTVPAGAPVAVLSYGFWQRRFASDPAVVGRKLTLNNKPVMVVGVLPQSFDFTSVFEPGTPVDVFIPWPVTEETNRLQNQVERLGDILQDLSD